MSRNGKLALVYHALFVAFMLAPILIVCWVAFTPLGYLSIPTREFSLRWFRAIGDYPEFIAAFRTSLWLAAVSSTVAVAVAVPAIGRGGTNALYLRPPDAIGMHFGDDSLPKFRDEAEAKGVEFVIHHSDSIALDLDEPSDLERLSRAV